MDNSIDIKDAKLLLSSSDTCAHQEAEQHDDSDDSDDYADSDN